MVHTKSRICIRLSVVTRFTRLHPGAQKGNAANYCSLFEPHYKQNLYTNPKRTAKSALLNVYWRCLSDGLFKKVSLFQRAFSFSKKQPRLLSHPLNKNRSPFELCQVEGKLCFCRGMSVKIVVLGLNFRTRAKGVSPSGTSESSRARSFPAPDARTQT